MQALLFRNVSYIRFKTVCLDLLISARCSKSDVCVCVCVLDMLHVWRFALCAQGDCLGGSVDLDTLMGIDLAVKQAGLSSEQ